MTTTEDLAVRDNVTVALIDCGPVRVRVPRPRRGLRVAGAARGARHD